MGKKFITIVFSALFIFTLAGCSSSNAGGASSSQSTNNSTQSSSSNNSSSTSKQSLKTALENELSGFTKVEQYIKKSDYELADTLAGQLHDEFHTAILPPLQAKKGATYAENVHAQYDALQNAITNKNLSQIKSLVKVNRANLYTVAKILGVSLN